MINERNLPILATLLVFIMLYGFGMYQYQGFRDSLVFSNLLTDNAFLIITAIGMTFVILSGGIDLSVGSMIAFIGVLMAYLISNTGMQSFVCYWHCLGCRCGLWRRNGGDYCVFRDSGIYRYLSWDVFVSRFGVFDQPRRGAD